MDGGNAGAEVPCACWQHRYRQHQCHGSSHTDTCSSVSGRGNPYTGSQHMERS